MKKKEINYNNNRYSDLDLDLDSDSSDEENNYNSDSSSDHEEFNHIKSDGKDKSKRKKGANPKSAEIRINIPSGVGSKENTTYLALVDPGSPYSLASKDVVGLRCRKKDTTTSTGRKAQAGDFKTHAKGNVD